jgi:hypothetical protein
MTPQEHNEAEFFRAIAIERDENLERREGCRDDYRERRDPPVRNSQEISMLRYFSTS